MFQEDGQVEQNQTGCEEKEKHDLIHHLVPFREKRFVCNISEESPTPPVREITVL
jgi:hypothetical protein